MQILKYLSYDVASESEITLCNKSHIPLVVYRFFGNFPNDVFNDMHLAKP